MSKLRLSCTMSTVSKTCRLKNFHQSGLVFCCVSPRDFYIFSISQEKSKLISPDPRQRVLLLLCGDGRIRVCQRVIFHPPINSPVGPDFSARNPIARFLPVQNKMRPFSTGTPSPRKSSCHVPFDPDLIHGRAEPSRLHAP